MKEYKDYIVYEDGRVYSIKTAKFLKPEVTRGGYHQVTLCTNGVPERIRVHQLVAKLFIRNKDNLPQINHKDGNKLNNNVDNLEWCTAYANNKHARESGLNKVSLSNSTRWDDTAFRVKTASTISASRKGKYIGIDNPNFKYKLLYKGKEYTAKELAPILNVSYSHLFTIIRNLKLGKQYKHEIQII